MQFAQEWDVFMRQVEGMPASIMLNLVFGKIGPVSDRPMLAWINLTLRNPEKGLAAREETETLTPLENELEKQISEKINGIYIGRLTYNGIRSFYFYCADPVPLFKIADAIFAAFKDYSYTSGSRQDPEWTIYNEALFPSGEEMRVMQNRRIVSELERHGDALEKARKIDHWLLFKNDMDLEKFLDKVLEQNYQIEFREKIDNPDFPIRLCISRVDHADFKSINLVNLKLYHLAIENNGFYDGWETMVVKDSN